VSQLYSDFLQPRLRRGGGVGPKKGVVLVVVSPAMGKSDLLEGPLTAASPAGDGAACLHACLRDLLQQGSGAVYFSATFLSSAGASDLLPHAALEREGEPPSPAVAAAADTLRRVAPSAALVRLASSEDLSSALRTVRERAEGGELAAGVSVRAALGHCAAWPLTLSAPILCRAPWLPRWPRVFVSIVGREGWLEGRDDGYVVAGRSPASCTRCCTARAPAAAMAAALMAPPSRAATPSPRSAGPRAATPSRRSARRWSSSRRRWCANGFPATSPTLEKGWA
jgi:hypothetical protein